DPAGRPEALRREFGRGEDAAHHGADRIRHLRSRGDCDEQSEQTKQRLHREWLLRERHEHQAVVGIHRTCMKCSEDNDHTRFARNSLHNANTERMSDNADVTPSVMSVQTQKKIPGVSAIRRLTSPAPCMCRMSTPAPRIPPSSVMM